MYLSQLTIRNFRQFGEGPAELQIAFEPGITALIGRNDSGKSTVLDAIRYALLTRDREFIRVQIEDFHIDSTGKQAREIFLGCKLAGFSDAEKGALIEYLSYENDDVVLYVNWTAKRVSEVHSARRWIDVSVRAGIDGAGPTFEKPARELLSGAYLRPLRDAEREMSPGRGSRLSQILFNIPVIKDGQEFDPQDIPADHRAVADLSLVGLADYMRHNVSGHTGIRDAEHTINKRYLASLRLRGDNLRSKIDVSEGGTLDARLRQILERLELGLLDAISGNSMGRYGLGSNNLLFIACELLLLGREPEGLPLLLIEEPEAHLHPQRQLRLMQFLSQAAKGSIEGTERAVQVLLSTHSPTLSSKIPLRNLVLLEGQHAFPLSEQQTRLEIGDYRFLERFLDVTKANLFFAHGVLIVEGYAEAILLPALAKLSGTDLTEHGVSIVNVGGKGLRRFSKIFQRPNDDAASMNIPVACIADLDVMPDCAPKILGLVADADDDKWQSSRRRWKADRDLGDDSEKVEAERAALRQRLQEHDGQSVQTFVADCWTFEYDLAFSGLAEYVYIAASLAKNDDHLNAGKRTRKDVIEDAKKEFQQLESEANGSKDILCSHVYTMFHRRGISKAITAQYLAEVLLDEFENGKLDTDALHARLPAYLRDAIAYVTPTTPFFIPDAHAT